ncbi:MAG: protein translocase subunit SecF, partial [Planctomycetota bacterium]|nr:protein translocase subunit SecF [Planctomycetota bacterium]
GMAVDSNILIYERTREERDLGKSLRQAVSAGFSRAFWAIFDSNITTLITALILIPIGTGPVRGFGVVLAIGIVCTMFSVLVVAQTILNLSVDKRIIRRMKMLQFIKNPRFNFIRWIPLAFVISAILVTGGVVLFSVRGDEKYGIEFTGGVLYQVNFHKPTSVADVRNLVSSVESLSNVSVTAVYTDTPGENREKGEAFQFLIKGRAIQETKNPSPSAGTDAPSDKKEEQKSESVERYIQKRFETLFGELLVPDSFPETDELLLARTKAQTENKLLLDVVVLTPLNEEECKKEIKGAMAKAGFADSSVEKQSFDEKYSGKYTRFRVIAPNVDFSKVSLEQALQNAHAALKGAETLKLPDPFPRIQSIGTSVAYNLKSKAIIALILAFIAIIIYVAIRFELIYGIAAVIALIHDVLAALGVIMLLDMLGILEIKIDLPVIAAFLTIIGYSLNDTIVIFDRIRESLRRRKFQAGAPIGFTELINDSINSTLSRTILTSLTTFIALLILFIFGVETLRGFTFTMMTGVCIGTYSTIYIASAFLILMRTEKYERAKALREMKEAEEERKRLEAELPYSSDESAQEEPAEEETVESPDMESYAAAEESAQKEERKKKQKKRK